jgi:hypothetical protein
LPAARECPRRKNKLCSSSCRRCGILSIRPHPYRSICLAALATKHTNGPSTT